MLFLRKFNTKMSKLTHYKVIIAPTNRFVNYSSVFLAYFTIYFVTDTPILSSKRRIYWYIRAQIYVKYKKYIKI